MCVCVCTYVCVSVICALHEDALRPVGVVPAQEVASEACSLSPSPVLAPDHEEEVKLAQGSAVYRV